MKGAQITINNKINASADGEKNGPKFVEPIPNVTVTVGRDASLPCVISNLGTYKVVWIHIDRQMVLTMHKYVITRIPRYSITVTGSIDKNMVQTWVLRVTQVQQEDRGYYMCQVNTNPVTSQVGYLQVTVPPVFVDDENTCPETVVVRENQNLTLKCKAQGFPSPKIAWKREDDRDIVLDKRNRGPVYSGEILHFDRISRSDMAGYFCIASNGVPPAPIKRIFINVEFSPIILVTNQLIANSIGSVAILECQTEAYPAPNLYWLRENRLIFQNSRYNIHIVRNGYQTITKLEVRNTSTSDLGDYTCRSKNALGETEGTIKLYEFMKHTTESTTFAQTNIITISAVTFRSDKWPKYITNEVPESRKTIETASKSNRINERLPKLNASFMNNNDYQLPANVYVHPKGSINLGAKFFYPSLYAVILIVASTYTRFYSFDSYVVSL